MIFRSEVVTPAQTLGARIEDIDPVGDELTEGELRLVSGGLPPRFSKTLNVEDGYCDADAGF